MAHCPLGQITTADGEICRFDRESSGRDINFLWIWIVDTCGYLCERGVARFLVESDSRPGSTLQASRVP